MRRRRLAHAAWRGREKRPPTPVSTPECAASSDRSDPTGARSTRSSPTRMCAAARAPRSRRSRDPPRRQRRARDPAAAGDRPRHRRPADLQRGPLDRRRPQRRDLQLPRAARRARTPRAHARDPGRHRGDRPSLRGARRGLRPPAARHVRLRALGRPPAASSCSPATGSARSRCSTACATGCSASPPRWARCSATRRSRARSTTRRSTPTWRSATCPRPLTALRGVRKLPPAHTLTLRDGKAELQRYWKLDYATKLTGVPTEEVLRAGPRRAAGGDAAPDDRRRPARRLPLRRDRLVRRRRRDGRAVGGAGAHVLDRLRPPGVRRAAARAPDRRAVRDRCTRSSRSAPTRSRSCRRSSATTASRSPTPRRSRASTCPS